MSSAVPAGRVVVLFSLLAVACGGAVDGPTGSDSTPGTAASNGSVGAPKRDRHTLFAAPPQWAGDSFATLRVCPDGGYEVTNRAPRVTSACASTRVASELTSSTDGAVSARDGASERTFYPVVPGVAIEGSYLVRASLGGVGEESIVMTRHAAFENGAFALVVALDKQPGSGAPTPYTSTVHGTYLSMGSGLVEIARPDQASPHRCAWFEVATPNATYAFIEQIGWLERVRK